MDGADWSIGWSGLMFDVGLAVTTVSSHALDASLPASLASIVSCPLCVLRVCTAVP